MDYLLRNFPEFVFSLAGALVLLGGAFALAVRFAVKPVMDSWLEIKKSATAEAERDRLDRRLDLLEAELQSLHKNVQMLIDADEFRRRLSAREDELLGHGVERQVPLS